MTWDIQKLFRHHAKDITRSLRRGGLNAETADDITQDTFVRVLSKPPAATASKNNPAAYLFQVARNLRIDHERRERLVKWIELPALDLAAIVDPAPSPETTTYDRQRLELTLAALAELPERTRKAFEMHRMNEMTIAEVAAQLGLSVSRTWALIRDAYEHIDARIEGF